MTQEAQAVAEEVLSEEQLQAKLVEAAKTGDVKAAVNLAGQLGKLQKANAQAEQDAKLKALETVTDKVKTTIQRALKPLVDNKELDLADGIWYTQDFGEKLITCKLMKSATKARKSSNGGKGKVFDITTTELLDKYGDEEYKEGQTFNQAHESITEKNARFRIREKLLKRHGLIQ